jgi:hypothetical protein
MTEQGPLRDRFLRRLRGGVFLILVLAGPVAYLAMDAINGLHNNPADWVPDSLQEKFEFNDFLRWHSATDLVMLSWDGATLDSQSIARAVAFLQPLCQQARADHEDFIDRASDL